MRIRPGLVAICLTGSVTSSAALDAKRPSRLAGQPDVHHHDDVDAVVPPALPTIYVLWNGIVVARLRAMRRRCRWTSVAATPRPQRSQASSSNNCWDGAALPAGDYTIVSVHATWPTAVETPASAEPTRRSIRGIRARERTPTTQRCRGHRPVALPPRSSAVTEAVPFTLPVTRLTNPFDKYLNPVDPTPTIPRRWCPPRLAMC